jgi:hypothetical protein
MPRNPPASPPRALALVGIALGLSTGCAPRPALCEGPRGCAATADCVAGQCLPKDATLPYVGTRRLVLRPVAMALLDRASPAGQALPPVFTMGRGQASAVALLLRFDLHLDAGATLLRASILLDRSEAPPSDKLPIALHAARVIGPWDPQRVTSSTAPPLEDLRLPATWVAPSSPNLVRVDVTSLARRWLRHDPADHGVVLVAENATPVGVTFALPGEASEPDPDPRAHEDNPVQAPQPPRLEIYAR